MDWWVWCVVGVLLLAAELLTPGFFLIFFGVGALAVGLLAGLGISGPLWVQLALFSAISVLLLVLLRQRLLLLYQPPSGTVDSLVGEVAIVQEDIEPGGVGRAELRGSGWNARNVSSRRLQKGERCRVRAVDGLTLSISAE